MIVVIPTSRAVSLEYLEPLIDFGARFIIVDDSEGKVRVDHPQFTVFTWQDQARMLGKDVIAIPRRNGACRDFGFFIAWRESADGEIVIALDDDCKVEEPDFGQSVQAVLSDARVRSPREKASISMFSTAIGTSRRTCFRGAFPTRSAPATVNGHSMAPRREPRSSISASGSNISNVNAFDKLQGPNSATRTRNCSMIQSLYPTAR